MNHPKLHVNLNKLKKYLLIKPEVSDAQQLSDNNGLILKYKLYPNGEVIWVMENNTNQDQYVILLRGATFAEGTVPMYIFGDAFAEVYYANGLSQFITSLDNIPLYSLAVIQYNNNYYIGFIFYLKAKSTLYVPEYGFNNVESLTGQLIPVQPQGQNLFVILYDYSETYYYEEETGINVNMPPDPYAVQSYLFTAISPPNIQPWNPTWRIIFQLPNNLVNAINKLEQMNIKQTILNILHKIINHIEKI
jgi:hypothetical protein